jgi:hypothetical protein
MEYKPPFTIRHGAAGPYFEDATGLPVPFEAVLALLNTRPSITEGVPEGFVTQEWSVLLVAPERAFESHIGTGPTPEAAISDAAIKAGREG